MTLKLVALAPTAALAVAAMEPTRWHWLGYEYEVGPVIFGVVACVSTRAWVSLSAKQHRWTVEAPVLALATMFTVAAIVGTTPNPIVSLLIGTGFGSLGAKIIERSKRFVDRILPDDPGEPGA